MARIAIIDHVGHDLWVEDIKDDVLKAEPYNGDVKSYIEANYTFEGNYSWNLIEDAMYQGVNNGPYSLTEKIDELKEEDSY